VLDPVRAWTASRELPELAEETFRERWKRRGRGMMLPSSVTGEGGGGGGGMLREIG
jgi:hypothetical protein